MLPALAMTEDERGVNYIFLLLMVKVLSNPVQAKQEQIGHLKGENTQI